MRGKITIFFLTSLVLGLASGSPRELDPEDLVKLVLVKSNLQNNETYKLADAEEIIKNIGFKNFKTAIYFHGMNEQLVEDSMSALATQFIGHGSHNFIIFDWRTYTNGPLPIPLHAKDVVRAAVNHIPTMFSEDYNADNFYFIGHGMGAHVAAAVARRINLLSNGRSTIPRVTGLDPSWLGKFSNIGVISASDATFVDIIHTTLSSFLFRGTADFWPYGGLSQPGCPSNLKETDLEIDSDIRKNLISREDDSDESVSGSASDEQSSDVRKWPSIEYYTCGSRKSYQYYAGSISRPDGYIALKCKTYKGFVEDKDCNHHDTGAMGYSATPTMYGSYFLFK